MAPVTVVKTALPSGIKYIESPDGTLTSQNGTVIESLEDLERAILKRVERMKEQKKKAKAA